MWKHTEGPWKWISIAGGWDGVGTEAGSEICKLVENNPANACLIAAAPEMLTMLKTLRAHAKGSLAETTKREMDRIILKAEGGGR